MRFYQISCVLCRFVRVKSLNIFRFDTLFSHFKTTFIPFLYQIYTVNIRRKADILAESALLSVSANFNISTVTALMSNHSPFFSKYRNDFFQNTENKSFKTPISLSEVKLFITNNCNILHFFVIRI